MANRLFSKFQASGTQQGGQITVHALKGNEEADVLALHDFQGAAGVVGAVEKNGTSDGVGDFGGDPFLPGVAPWGADAAGEVGPAGTDQLQQGGEVRGIVLAVPIHHGGVGAGGGKEAGVEGGTLAEVFGKMNDVNSFFLLEQG